MQREAQTYLWDALQAAQRVARFTAGRTFAEYEIDDLLRSAVERQFEIIGEALSRLRATDPELAAQLPDLARIVAFRNILIHRYASVDDKLVWGIVEGKVASLVDDLRRLLEG